MVTIVNVGYLSTNYWVVSARTGAGTSRLLIDLGYPGTMGRMRANLRRMDVPFEEIRYAVATHYHIDHAGLAEELKQAGVPLVVLEPQVAAIPLMKRHTKPSDNYVDIRLDDNIVDPVGGEPPPASGIGHRRRDRAYARAQRRQCVGAARRRFGLHRRFADPGPRVSARGSAGCRQLATADRARGAHGVSGARSGAPGCFGLGRRHAV